MRRKIAAIGAVMAAAGIGQADLVHRYVFEGNANDSVGTLNGNLTGSGTYLETPQFAAVTPAGTAPDGPSQSIAFGMNKGGNKKSGFTLNPAVINQEKGTVSFFARIDAGASGGATYLFSALPLANGPLVLMPNLTSQVRVTMANTEVGTTDNKALNEWHHIGVTWEKSGTDLLSSFYVDGSLVGSQAIANGSTAPTTVRVGGFNLADDTLNIANQFVGRMYDLQLYDVALTASDVQGLYDNPGSVIPEPAVLGLAGATAFLGVVARRVFLL